MKANAASLRIALPCKGCGEKFTQSVGWFRSHQHFPCACGVTTQVHLMKLAQFDIGKEESRDSARTRLLKRLKG